MTATSFTPFAVGESEVPVLKDRACLGYVDSVGTAKISQSGAYVVQPITLSGSHGAPAKNFVTLLYRPEWLREGFNPKELDKGPSFVYRKNIGGERNPDDKRKANGMLSALAGLAGSWDAFIELSGKIIVGVRDVEDAEVPAVVEGILREHFVENGAEVGFVLTQKTEKTDEIGENGKPVYVRLNGYQVDRFFFPATETQYMQKLAAADKVILTFEA